MTTRFWPIILFILITVPYTHAEEATNPQTAPDKEHEKFVSPIGAMVRSGVFPGWGQFYSRSYIRGGLITAGIAGSVVGALLAEKSFRNRYNDYATLASLELDNEEEIFQSYNHANQRYKLRMFFLYAGVGIWVYSIIDSYVSANFFNAKTQIQSIQRDALQIENKLGIKLDATPTHLYLGIVKTF